MASKLLQTNHLTSSFDLKTQEYPAILSAAAEYKLALRFYDKNDLVAAQKLVLSHIRFVAFIAHGYRGYGLEIADLIQEGTVGLMKAVKKFNPHKKVRLSSFAVYWIRAEIHEYVLKNWKIVKIATTKAQRKLFFKLNGAKKHIHQLLTHDQAANIAEDLGVKQKDVFEMETRLQGTDVSFTSDYEDDFAPEDYLTDDSYAPDKLLEEKNEKEHNHTQLNTALAQLDKRSLDILQQRYLKEKKMTLHSLADKYDVSAERIRQLENLAIKTLKEKLTLQH